MAIFSNRTRFTSIYEEAETPEDLPWHQDEPWPMLRRVVEQRSRKVRALDLGCGAGGLAIYLARNGYDVTGIDMNETALRMAEAQARRADVDLTLIQADVVRWNADLAYDLVLDSGCYHGLSGSDRETYRDRLLQRLGRDGDFVLVHFGKKHLLDWRPMGPYRRSRETIRMEFAPELQEVEYAEQIQKGVPLPVGPRPLVGQYWFRHAHHVGR